MTVPEAVADVLVRVECTPHATDAEVPIRLLVLNADGKTLIRMNFTPDQARSSAQRVSRILSWFIPVDSARRIGDGLLRAAVTVWSTRN